MKILSAEQCRAADRATIEREGITPTDLMERAGLRCAAWISQHVQPGTPLIIMAGVGNNGGDALVIARHLLTMGYSPRVYVVRYHEQFSVDMQINLERWQRAGAEVSYILEEQQFPEIPLKAIVIDGIFGTGLNRPVVGLAAFCIEMLNASIAEVISIDIPSGLFSDGHRPEGSPAVMASYTLALESPKLSFLLPESGDTVGQWEIIPLGLDQRFVESLPREFFFTETIRDHAHFFQRNRFDHKGRFGHVLISAGSEGKMGAAVLSVHGALRAGSGLVTAHIPRVGYEIMQASMPEAMCSCDDEVKYLSALPNLDTYRSVVCGPGIGTNKKTKRLIRQLLQSKGAALVLDADALNIIAEEKWITEVPKNSILTPHVGEFDRLFGKSTDAIQRLEKLRKAAVELTCHIVLKGAYTAVATPRGEIHFNATGNPGMAKGGSGDVLSGVIGALLAQCGDPEVAARCGVFIHGRAGDLAAQELSEYGMCASDTADFVGLAMVGCFDSEE